VRKPAAKRKRAARKVEPKKPAEPVAVNDLLSQLD